MGRTAARLLMAATTVAALMTSGRASQVVEINVRGHYFSAPATVIVNVAVEPGEQNYKLVIEADSERFFRSSEIELTGVSDKRIHTMQFKNLPEGEYELRAEVRSRRDILGKAMRAVTVMGVNAEPFK